MTFLGLLAGVFTTACWLPQLARSWRTRSTHDFSWGYLLVLSIGISLWLLYGILRRDPAIIASNVVTLMSLLFLTALKSRHRSRMATPSGTR
jgi:MtN3 and saliva related transmembrane protein